MFLLVYNLVRMTVLEAAKRQGVPPERISFVDALRWLATAKPGDELPELGKCGAPHLIVSSTSGQPAWISFRKRLRIGLANSVAVSMYLSIRGSLLLIELAPGTPIASRFGIWDFG